MAEDQARKEMEGKLGVTLTFIEYCIPTKIDFCTSSLAVGTLELLRLIGRSNKVPSTLHPSHYFKKTFNRSFHVNQIAPRTCVRMTPNQYVRNRCPDCGRSVDKRALHFHKCEAATRA
jgi:hypothetical protein